MDTRTILAEQIKAKRLKPHHLMNAIKPNDEVIIGDKWVRVRKVKTGQYTIERGDVGKDKGDIIDTLDGPAPAKLAFIDAMVDLVPEQK